MVAEFGQFLLALQLPVLFAGIFGIFYPLRSVISILSRRCLLLAAGLGVFAFVALALNFANNDLSVRLVASTSHETLPMLYRITATWGNHSGSLLLFNMIMAVTMAIAVYTRPLRDTLHGTLIASICSVIVLAFAVNLYFFANPFLRLNPYPNSGLGLNPVLQNPLLAVHPPILYIGYSCIALIYAFAIAVLLRPVAIAAWANAVKIWVTIAWTFLLIGITLGAIWAYTELGWGGYWFWDPVENVSLMPWIIMTALLHSLILLIKRKTMLRFSIVLAIVSFCFVLISFFIVRSGVLISVHAFADNPLRGRVMLTMLSAALITGALLFGIRAKKLATGIDFHPLSRDTLMLIGNLLFVCIALLILMGTVYPLIAKALLGRDVTITANWYNQVVAPLFVVIATLAAITPLLSFKDNIWIIPKLRTIIAVAIAVVLGFGLGWLIYREFSLLILLWVAMAMGLALTVLDVSKRKTWPSMAALAKFIAHSALVILIPIIIHGYLFAREANITWNFADLASGSPANNSLPALDYQISVNPPQESKVANYLTNVLPITITDSAGAEFSLSPERRRYHPGAIETSEVAIANRINSDIYVTISPLPFQLLGEDPAEKISIRVAERPGMIWIWLFTITLIGAGIVSLIASWARMQKFWLRQSG